MRPAVLALELDAGPDRQKRPRRLLVLVDDRGEVVRVLRLGQDPAKEFARREGIVAPLFGPLDVLPGVYRRFQHAGTPVERKRHGRTRAEPLRVSFGSGARGARSLRKKLEGP